MKVTTQHFITWLMGLTRIMRYFVVAVLFHVALLTVLGSIKIVAKLPRILPPFKPIAFPPPPPDTIPDDPYAVLRDFAYNGPTLGGGGGTPGKGPGGVPTAGGGTKDKYTVQLLPSGGPSETPSMSDVIGVLSEVATALARPTGQGGGSGSSMVAGLGAAIGTGGIRGLGGTMLGARMGPQKAVAMKDFGATASTEKAVLAALRWLKKNQQPDGSWKLTGADQAGAGLALLTFLGHAETPDSPEFGATVDKAIRYLVTQVKSDGIVTGNMYVQGIVTLALAESFALTQSPIVREPLERAVGAIIKAQKVHKESPLHKGGWRYTPTSNDADLSAAGWQVMALKSARNAGLEIPTEVFDDAAKYVWNMYGGPGFGYTGPSTTPNLTGVGVLCQQFLGNSDDRRLRPALEYLEKIKMDWNVKGALPLYGWYYITQAMFQGGRSYWISWNNQMRDTLVKIQKEDGHWDAPEGGSHEPALGPVYSTTLCALMLEVYYRYLPMYALTGPGKESSPGPTTPALPGILR